MVLEKACPTCGFGNVPTSPFCIQCGVSLVSITPLERAETTVEKGRSLSRNDGKNVCPDCGAKNDDGCDRCVYCDCALGVPACEEKPFHVELIWPWGTEQLIKPLRIGRESPAPDILIKAINAYGYDNISRSHAELLPDCINGRMAVVDLGSSNGTFVDGVRIPPNEPTILKNGAVIRFAANLSVSVSIYKN